MRIFLVMQALGAPYREEADTAATEGSEDV